MTGNKFNKVCRGPAVGHCSSSGLIQPSVKFRPTVILQIKHDTVVPGLNLRLCVCLPTLFQPITQFVVAVPHSSPVLYLGSRKRAALSNIMTGWLMDVPLHNNLCLLFSIPPAKKTPLSSPSRRSQTGLLSAVIFGRLFSLDIVLVSQKVLSHPGPYKMNCLFLMATSRL